MDLELEGKVFKINPEQTGQGKNGEWVKQDFVIETEDQYPKKICITGWGDKAGDIKKLRIGDKVKIGINIESREFNEKWYTDVKAWRIEMLDASTPQAMPYSAPTDVPPIQDSGSDDLPF